MTLSRRRKGRWLFRARLFFPAADLLPISHAEILRGRGVGTQAIGDDLLRTTMPFERFCRRCGRQPRRRAFAAS